MKAIVVTSFGGPEVMKTIAFIICPPKFDYINYFKSLSEIGKLYNSYVWL
jgi:hypothetical protein